MVLQQAGGRHVALASVCSCERLERELLQGYRNTHQHTATNYCKELGSVYSRKASAISVGTAAEISRGRPTSTVEVISSKYTAAVRNAAFLMSNTS